MSVLVFHPSGKFVLKSTIADAASADDVVGKTIVITSAETLSGNVTIPSTINVEVQRGAMITTGAYTLTINGQLSAGAFQWVTGNLVVGSKAAPFIRPEWTGTTSDELISRDYNINVGSLTSASPNDAVLVCKSIVGATNRHAFRDESVISGVTDAGYYGTYDGATRYSGTFDADHLHCFQGRTEWDSSGTLDKMSTVYSLPVVSQGDVNILHHVLIKNRSGAGTVDLQNAIRIEDLTSATTNYAIVSLGNIPSYHYGTFTVGGIPTIGIAINSKHANLTGTAQVGIGSNGSAFDGKAYAQANASITSLYGLSIQASDKGSGASVTNNYGLWVAAQTAGTNNYGLYLLNADATNTWNIYAGGTAQNYIRGKVGIGAGMFRATAQLQVAGSVDGSAGTASIKIQAAGALLVTPESGVLEYDGTKLYFTLASGVRKEIAFV
jgi:hypothetical protein